MKKDRKMINTLAWLWITVVYFWTIGSFVLLEADLVGITERAKISLQYTTCDTYFTSAFVLRFKDRTKLVNVQLNTNSLSTQSHFELE